MAKGYSWFVARFPYVIIILVIVLIGVAAYVVMTFAELPSFTDPTDGFEARGTEIKGRSSAAEVFRSSDGIVMDRRKREASLSNGTFANLVVDDGRSEANPEDCPIIGPNDQNYFMQLVFASSRSGETLLTTSALKAMCGIETDVLLTSNLVSYKHCRGPSLPYYVAKMVNKDCMDLEDDDVALVLDTLKECAPYYYSGDLPGAPFKCSDQGHVYAIMHFIANKGFLNPETMDDKIVYALMGVRTYKFVEYYKQKLANGNLDNGIVKIVGIDSDHKFSLFDEYLVEDMFLFVIAAILILVFLCLYLRSFVITLATIFDVAFSFILAYFIYKIVFQIEYFPFMNILTMLILIAVGADDVFIFFDTWQQTKEQYPNKQYSFWVYTTMNHAAVSIFVTSLTTASAFFANVVSEITSIKCFGIFSGTAILCNFLMMITWIPATIILIEWANAKFCSKVKCCEIYDKIVGFMESAGKMVFGNVLPTLITKAWFVWLIVFFGLGIGGIIMVFVTPKLNLPSSSEFQVFDSDNPIERYDRELKYEFRFILEENAGGASQEVYMYWGLKAEDNGNKLDPQSRSSQVYDNTFEFASTDAQTWMLELCLKIRNTSYVHEYYRNNIYCSLELFNDYMRQMCFPVNTLEPCCGHSGPPFAPDLFKQCYRSFMDQSNANAIGTPHFNDDNDIKVYEIRFVITQGWSPSYKVAEELYERLESLLNIKDAPPGLKGGWFTGQFRFYDLQNALSTGTYIAIGLSLVVAFVVMLLTSLNILITIYAIITIALTIFLTVGVLVLLGWELNILESVVISLAVGLSIDFSIHYGVAYRLCEDKDPVSRMRHSFERVGSAVAMAAFTTFLAGAAIMSTELVAYKQLGTFFMLVMAISWAYATFFFQSLCRIIGPHGKFAQIPSPFSKLCSSKDFLDSPRVEDIQQPSEKDLPGQSAVKLDEETGEKPVKINKNSETIPVAYDNPAFDTKF